MKTKINRLLSITILIFLTLLSSCDYGGDPVIELDGSWSYSINGISGTYKSCQLTDFSFIKKNLPERKGDIYLKTHFIIPPELKNKPIRCYLGNIKIASELYLNGNYIGQSGFFSPTIFSIGGRATAFDLPYVLCNNDTPNELIIHIYVEGEGKIGEAPFISTTNRVLAFEKVFDFFNHGCF